MTELELNWLAGLLEGEGSFSRQTEKYPSGIYLQMVDEDVVNKASLLLGSKCHKVLSKNPKYKDTYKTSLRGKPAIEMMKLLLPYMGIRRSSRIRECFECFTIKPKGIAQEVVSEIRQRFQNGEKPKEIAKDYPVTYWRVYQLVRDLRNADMV